MIGCRVGIIGFGAFGCQIRTWLNEVGEDVSEVIGFDDLEHSREGVTVAPFEGWRRSEWDGLRFAIGLGYRHLGVRQDLIRELQAAHRPLVNVIHPAAKVSGCARIGRGVIIGPAACIDQNVVVGDGAIVHTGALVCHDVAIGESAYISPGAVICGGVKIGNRAFVGAGVSIANDRKIGEDSEIGIGSVVTRDVEVGRTVIGNPLRDINRRLRL